jgi:hypothetical protein
MYDERRPYKIMLGDIVEIERNDVKGFTFYYIVFFKKNKNGEAMRGVKQVRFLKGVTLENKTTIRLLDFFEDFYIPKIGYDTVWELTVTDFEIIDVRNSYKEYKQSLMEYEEELPF